MERATRGETLSFGSSQRTRGPPWPSSSTTSASVDDADEEAAQMRAAIAASLGEDMGAYTAVPAGRGGAELEELSHLAAALVASTAGGSTTEAATGSRAQWGYAGDADEDADLRAAIAASLATDPLIKSPSAPQQLQQQEEEEVVPVPPQPDAGEEGVIQLALRLPTGARFVRRFHSSTSLKVSVISRTPGSSL